MSFGSSRWAVSLYFSSTLNARRLKESSFQTWVLDEDESIEIMKAAWDRGINTIDTANVYSNGESEKVIGKFLKKVRAFFPLFTLFPN